MPYELKKTTSGEYMFNLKAGNYEVILTSERYKAKSGALNGIASVRVNGVMDERFEHRTSTAGEPYFVLKAANGEIIGRSEMYSSAAARDKGIESVKTNSPSTVVDDKTE